MNLVERVKSNFADSIKTKQESVAILADSIAMAAEQIVACLL